MFSKEEQKSLWSCRITHPSVLAAALSCGTFLIGIGRTAILGQGNGGETGRDENRGTHYES